MKRRHHIFAGRSEPLKGFSAVRLYEILSDMQMKQRGASSRESELASDVWICRGTERVSQVAKSQHWDILVICLENGVDSLERGSLNTCFLVEGVIFYFRNFCDVK